MRTRTAVLLLVVVTIFLCAAILTAQAVEPQTSDNFNFFDYAVDITENGFAPGGLDFYIPLHEVLSIKNVEVGAVEKQSGPNSRVHIKTSYQGLSENVNEVYNFYDGLLSSAIFTMTVGAEEYKDVCETLYNQALNAMPEPTEAGKNLSGIREGSCIWHGENGSIVSLSGTQNPNAAPEDPYYITISITNTKENLLAAIANKNSEQKNNTAEDVPPFEQSASTQETEENNLHWIIFSASFGIILIVALNVIRIKKSKR